MAIQRDVSSLGADRVLTPSEGRGCEPGLFCGSMVHSPFRLIIQATSLNLFLTKFLGGSPTSHGSKDMGAISMRFRIALLFFPPNWELSSELSCWFYCTLFWASPQSLWVSSKSFPLLPESGPEEAGGQFCRLRLAAPEAEQAALEIAFLGLLLSPSFN